MLFIIFLLIGMDINKLNYASSKKHETEKYHL